jgi:heat shock protein HtpX
MVAREYRHQKVLRLVQTVLLTAGMVFLAARAATIVVGPVLGWVMVATAPAITLHALIGQRLLLPAGTRALHPREAPEVYRLLRDLVARAGLKRVPPVYLLPGGQAEALTTGVGEGTRLLLSRGIFARLSTRELGAVLAHEVSHIRNLDLPLFAMVSAMQRITRLIAGLFSVLVIIFFPLILAGVPVIPPRALLYMAVAPIMTVLVQFALLRTREFQADLGAAELTGDPEALASALVKLEYLRRPFWNLLTGTGQRSSRMGELLRTHPGTEERVERLRELMSSGGDVSARMP